MASKQKIDGFTNYHVRVGRAVAIHTPEGRLYGIVKRRDDCDLIVNCHGVDKKFDLRDVVALWEKHALQALIAWAHDYLVKRGGGVPPTAKEVQQFLDENKP